MRRFLIQTFGCQMNAHDSRRIAEVLGQEGYTETDEAELADLIVLNTCSVREKAEHKLVSALGTYRPLKERRSDVLIAVAGCMAQEHGAELLERQDLIDVLIGPDNVPELPALLARARDGERVALAEHDLLQPRFLNAEPRPDGREVFAYVTTMKGCDERCSFCIVPYTRGAERYRAADEILAEVRGLVAGGVKEITLLGQTVNSWHEAPATGRARALPAPSAEPLGPHPTAGSRRPRATPRARQAKRLPVPISRSCCAGSRARYPSCCGCATRRRTRATSRPSWSRRTRSSRCCPRTCTCRCSPARTLCCGA